ncbi:MAG: hypothetical protein FWE61_09625 [Micrococcales bacterium]|nr:hypothetical protein [Micrococcales bacterium]
MDTMQKVARPEVTNLVDHVPAQRSPQSSAQPHVAPSLVPMTLVTGGYAALVGLLTAFLCVIGG